jgi:membrane associated rhomboid family serine protease
MDLSHALHDTPVACVLLALTIAYSFIAFYNDTVYEKSILHPYSVYRGKSLYTLITSGFIHADLMHLFFNMFTFFFFAFTLEHTLGSWQFCLLYFLSMVLADLPSVVKHKDDYGYRSLGASGAISAVLFSYILFNPLDSLYLMFLPIPIPSIIFGVLYLIYCSYASKRQLGNINHDAHFFGAVAGMMITVVLNPHVLADFAHTISAKLQSFGH